MPGLTLRGGRITEDEKGFVCLNDMWRAAGEPSGLRPSNWRAQARCKTLAAALLEIIGTAYSSDKNKIESAIYASGRGRTAQTFAHPVVARHCAMLQFLVRNILKYLAN